MLSFKFQPNKKELEKNIKIHILPCKISFDGKTDVNSYFSSSIIQSDKSQSMHDLF